MRVGSMIVRPLHHVILAAFSFIMAFPFIWMITSAFKTNDEIWAYPPVLLPDKLLWENISKAWHAAPFDLYVFNSVFVSVCIVLIQTVNSAMTAYALVHMRFPLGRPLLAIILVSYMLPGAATYLPGYIILSNLGLIDTYGGLIISNSVSVFTIFMIYQAFRQIPREVVEAAKIDGAPHRRILWTMVIPLTAPYFVVTGLITFIEMYNNYLWPSLITHNPDLYLVSAGLRSFFIEGGAYGMNWAQVMAASSFTILPLLILFIFAQKFIMKGVSQSYSVNKG
ncbi:carbohydrate ABC transporter permease [Paenibacillus chitinolyticus]